MPDATPEEALAFFTKRYEDLAFEVHLPEQRVKSGTVGPTRRPRRSSRCTPPSGEAQAVGDLEALDARLQALTGTIDKLREKRKAERAAKLEAARAEKERIAAEAEKLAEGNDWRNGATACATCSRSGKLSPGSRSPSTTPCGGDSRARVRPTPAAASRTSAS